MKFNLANADSSIAGCVPPSRAMCQPTISATSHRDRRGCLVWTDPDLDSLLGFPFRMPKFALGMVDLGADRQLATVKIGVREVGLSGWSRQVSEGKPTSRTPILTVRHTFKGTCHFGVTASTRLLKSLALGISTIRPRDMNSCVVCKLQRTTATWGENQNPRCARDTGPGRRGDLDDVREVFPRLADYAIVGVVAAGLRALAAVEVGLALAAPVAVGAPGLRPHRPAIVGPAGGRPTDAAHRAVVAGACDAPSRQARPPPRRARDEDDGAFSPAPSSTVAPPARGLPRRL